MLERGVILNRTDETVVRLLPPFLITKKHVDAAVRQLEQVLGKAVAQTAGAAERRTK
jgi:acetylornithine aminotransferase/acetylornithine/N-succinyldiaminopimelate aminotransferase